VKRTASATEALTVRPSYRVRYGDAKSTVEHLLPLAANHSSVEVEKLKGGLRWKGVFGLDDKAEVAGFGESGILHPSLKIKK
jgi:hypothetical protein